MSTNLLFNVTSGLKLVRKKLSDLLLEEGHRSRTKPKRDQQRE